MTVRRCGRPSLKHIFETLRVLAKAEAVAKALREA